METAATISPELVLVYPEMREEAIAQLPDYSWERVLADARLTSHPSPVDPVAHESISQTLRSMATWMTSAFVLVAGSTLAMTLIANSLR